MKNVFIKAAELIACGDQIYSCSAVDLAAYFSSESDGYEIFSKERMFYIQNFCPTLKEFRKYTNNPYCTTEEFISNAAWLDNENERVIALLLCALLVEDLEKINPEPKLNKSKTSK